MVIGKVRIQAKEVGHGSTRAARALSSLLHGDSWSGHLDYDHEISGVNVDKFYRWAHQLISTHEMATWLYNQPLFFELARRIPNSHGFTKWAESFAEINDPVILCHESLAHALSRIESKQTRFLYTLNIVLKPGERDVRGLDGIIVRSEHSRAELIKSRFPDEKIHVGTVVDPDIVSNRDEDFQRRAARLELVQNIAKMSDLKWLTSDSLGKDYKGMFTIALITSGAGHYPYQIREVIQSFREPLARELVNLVLIGGYDHPKSPMRVAEKEALRLGLKPEFASKYSQNINGFQIVYTPNTRELVSSSVQLIRRADVVLLTSATDILGTTEAAACPTFVGNYRGLHERADGLNAVRSCVANSAIYWDRDGKGWTDTRERIFNEARRRFQGQITLYRRANALYDSYSKMHGASPAESNAGIKSFIENRI